MKSVALTDVGKKREINQDFVFCSDTSVGLLPNLYIVADGMGGHKAGDFASRFCVDEFEKELRESKGRTLIGCMEEAIRHTNDKLIRAAATSPDYEGMGTTFVAVTIDEKDLYVANIGDSRMYRIAADGEIRQITEDHSLVEEMIRNGEIERKDAKHHPQKNLITRALGAEGDIVPDFFEISVEEGDCILLCSDGLTNMVEDETIRQVVRDKEISLAERARQLIDLANEQGGKDNISVVLVQI